jgi:hypothetical protein
MATLTLVLVDTSIADKIRQLISDDSRLSFHYENNSQADTTVTLINMADYPMDTIRRWAKRILELKPKVVAVDNFSDTLYNIEKPDARIILPIISEDGKHFEYSTNNITTDQIHGVALVADYFRMTKYFPSQEKLPSFAIQIIKEYNSDKYSETIKRDKRELINYLPTKSFTIIDFPDLYPDKILESYVRGKIVIFGYLGSNSNHLPDILDNNDSHLTPLGKMFGPIIIANQIQTLMGNGMVEPSQSTILIFSLIIMLLTYFLISRVKSTRKLLVIVGLNVTLVLLVVLVSFISMLLLDKYDIFVSIESIVLSLTLGFQTGIISILSGD